MDIKTLIARIRQIEKGQSIYETRFKREYAYGGNGTYLNELALTYLIPKRDNLGYNLKKIRVEHFQKALDLLLKKGQLTRKDLKENDCGNSCNFTAFYGMLHFVTDCCEKEHGRILLSTTT